MWKTQCGNYGDSLSRFLGKNFVKTTHLLNELPKELIQASDEGWGEAPARGAELV